MSNDIENQKAKIRERYKGKLLDDVEIIPALPQPKLYDDNRVKRVAAYARVSTIDINQTTSYELQKNHYTDLIQKHEVGFLLIYMQMKVYQEHHLIIEMLLSE